MPRCGPFSAEAAAKVTGAELKTLLALVANSLLQDWGKQRYNLHVALRRYGEEKLVAGQEETQSGRRAISLRPGNATTALWPLLTFLGHAYAALGELELVERSY